LTETGAMLLEGISDDYKRNPDCQRHDPTPGDRGATPPR
jgi:hypothetical protein